MTIGELQALLSTFPRDMPLAQHPVKNHSMDNEPSPTLCKVSLERVKLIHCEGRFFAFAHHSGYRPEGWEAVEVALLKLGGDKLPAKPTCAQCLDTKQVMIPGDGRIAYMTCPACKE